MGYDWLLIGSIVLGLFAWALPLLSIGKFRKNKDVLGTYMVYSSFICAVLSLLLVITYRNYLIRIEDWSALMDTIGGFQFASVILATVTGVLNSVALAFKFKMVQSK